MRRLLLSVGRALLTAFTIAGAFTVHGRLNLLSQLVLQLHSQQCSTERTASSKVNLGLDWLAATLRQSFLDRLLPLDAHPVDVLTVHSLDSVTLRQLNVFIDYFLHVIWLQFAARLGLMFFQQIE